MEQQNMSLLNEEDKCPPKHFTVTESHLNVSFINELIYEPDSIGKPTRDQNVFRWSVRCVGAAATPSLNLGHSSSGKVDGSISAPATSQVCQRF